MNNHFQNRIHHYQIGNNQFFILEVANLKLGINKFLNGIYLIKKIGLVNLILRVANFKLGLEMINSMRFFYLKMGLLN